MDSFREWRPSEDEFDHLIWEEVRGELAARRIPSLLLFFVHEVLVAKHPDGVLTDGLMLLQSEVDTMEEAFVLFTERLLEQAEVLFGRWKATQPAEVAARADVRVRPAEKKAQGPATEAVSPPAPRDPQPARADTALEVTIATALAATDDVERDGPMGIPAHREPEPVDAAGAVDELLGIASRADGEAEPPDGPSVRAADMDAPPDHVGRTTCLMRRGDLHTGPILVKQGTAVGCVTAEVLHDEGRMALTVAEGQAPQLWQHGRYRDLHAGGVEAFAHAALVHDGWRGLDCGVPADRRIAVCVGDNTHTVRLAAATEAALAGAMPAEFYAARGVGPAQVDDNWYSNFRRHRDEVLAMGCQRASNMTRKSLRLKFEAARRRWLGDHSGVADLLRRDGMMAAHGWPAAAVSDSRLLEGIGPAPRTTELARVPLSMRRELKVSYVDYGTLRVYTGLGDGGTLADFWRTVDDDVNSGVERVWVLSQDELMRAPMAHHSMWRRRMTTV